MILEDLSALLVVPEEGPTSTTLPSLLTGAIIAG